MKHLYDRHQIIWVIIWRSINIPVPEPICSWSFFFFWMFSRRPARSLIAFAFSTANSTIGLFSLVKTSGWLFRTLKEVLKVASEIKFFEIFRRKSGQNSKKELTWDILEPDHDCERWQRHSRDFFRDLLCPSSDENFWSYFLSFWRHYERCHSPLFDTVVSPLPL